MDVYIVCITALLASRLRRTLRPLSQGFSENIEWVCSISSSIMKNWSWQSWCDLNVWHVKSLICNMLILTILWLKYGCLVLQEEMELLTVKVLIRSQQIYSTRCVRSQVLHPFFLRLSGLKWATKGEQYPLTFLFCLLRLQQYFVPNVKQVE